MSTAARALVVALCVACATWAGAQGAAFSARLSMTPIDRSLQATVTGGGSVEAVLDGRELRLDGAFTGLAAPATAARLHIGAATGVRGAPFADLTIDAAPSGTITGTVRLTRAEAAALEDGRMYVQVESSAAPDGNLWGWLLP